jgi:hypothetical protein
MRAALMGRCGKKAEKGVPVLYQVGKQLFHGMAPEKG